MSRTFAPALTVVLAFVTTAAHAVGWGTQVTIKKYQAQTNGNVFVYTSGNENPDGCPNTSWLIISDTNYRFVVETARSAQANGQTVALYYNGCLGGYANITAIAVPTD